jgi:hypothetical protein
VKLHANWIVNAKVDVLTILSIPFVALLCAFIFHTFQISLSTSNVFHWLLLVVFIDAGHVYGTLFKTYFAVESQVNFPKKLLWIVPVVCFLLLFLIHTFWSNTYWKCIAYFAVFHFVRQQYGFMRLYSKEKRLTMIDQLTIYVACLYPMLYWHVFNDRSFVWMSDDDFIGLSFLEPYFVYFKYAYFIIIGLYVGQEVWSLLKTKNVYLSKNLVLVGTFLNWYFSIIYFDSDLIFTFLNIVSHGVPYIFLVYFSESRKRKYTLSRIQFQWISFILFTSFIFFLAFIEEGLWDALVWHEHTEIFKWFRFTFELPSVEWKFIVVPLLTLPQVTHYVFDGIVWKSRQG